MKDNEIKDLKFMAKRLESNIADCIDSQKDILAMMKRNVQRMVIAEEKAQAAFYMACIACVFIVGCLASFVFW